MSKGSPKMNKELSKRVLDNLVLVQNWRNPNHNRQIFIASGLQMTVSTTYEAIPIPSVSRAPDEMEYKVEVSISTDNRLATLDMTFKFFGDRELAVDSINASVRNAVATYMVGGEVATEETE